jgi:hypothetical protein
MIRTILVPLTAELSGEPLLDAALVLARQVNAHIRALFILPNPHAVLGYLPDVILAAGVTREVIERETQESAAEAKERFIDWRTRNDVQEAASGRLDTCFATWVEQIGELETVVTRCAQPRGKPGFPTLDSSSGREMDSPLERSGFEPSVPAVKYQPLGRPASSERLGWRLATTAGNQLLACRLHVQRVAVVFRRRTSSSVFSALPRFAASHSQVDHS